MLPGIGAAAISAGASLAGGIGQTIANAIQNKQNQKFQREETQKARDWQEHMYKTYNSPQAQAHQLASAGINPYNQGGASTTPMSTSTSAPTPATTPYDFSFIGEAADKAVGHIQNSPVLKAQVLANEASELDIESKRIQIRRDLMAEIREAIDTGNYEKAATLNLQLISETIKDTKESRKVKIATRNKLQREFDNLVEDHKEKVRNNQLGDAAAAAGVNSAIDEHNLKVAQTKLAEASAKLSDTQRHSVQFALDLSKKYDEKFMDLSFQERQQQVKEFLDTAETRASMLEFAKEIQKNAKEISNRANSLDEVQSRIVRDMLTAVEDNMNSDSLIDNIMGIFGHAYVSNPTSTLSAITNMIPDFNWNTTNRNTYSTVKNFGSSK